MKSTNLSFIQARREDPLLGHIMLFFAEREAELKEELVGAAAPAVQELQGRIKELKFLAMEFVRQQSENVFKSGAYNP